jgi:CRISPR/Cas system-associated endoribonuclease Cas2
MYNDDSLFLETNKYRFTALKNIPAKYLLNIQNSTKDEELKLYIKVNLEKLKKRAELEKEKHEPIILIKCKKNSYLTEKEAMIEIVRISRRTQDNKKPVRVYKCKCGAFHITSKEFS